MNRLRPKLILFVRSSTNITAADALAESAHAFSTGANGYLHIGHAKSICLNSGIAQDYGGLTNLRFDDTNPVKEDTEYVESIKDTIRWLGFDWGEREYYASDYFEVLYQNAVRLIEKGKAYVCDLTPDEVREYRGTLTEPGRESPYRNRSVEENLDLFRRMRAGEFPDGSRTLRAKIDMASPNLNLRDPIMYRILHAEHHRTGNKWCIYPMYDYAHCVSDSVEGITHSICTLEFEDHRPLYDWFLDELELYHPQQIEFARLNLTYTVMSKRKLLQLVQQNYVGGWDDPRMPTLAGMRRRGYTPEAIRKFADVVGVAKNNSVVDMELLERFTEISTCGLSAWLCKTAQVVLDNYPQTRWKSSVPDFPQDRIALPAVKCPGMGFTLNKKTLWKYLRPSTFASRAAKCVVNACYITCTKVVKDADGQVIEAYLMTPKRGGVCGDGERSKAPSIGLGTARRRGGSAPYDNLFSKRPV